MNGEVAPEPVLQLWGINLKWYEVAGATAAGVANIAIACLLAWLALSANRQNRESPFTQTIIKELYDLGVAARILRGRYAALFKGFKELQSKRAAHAEWMRQSDEIQSRLYDLCSMFPELEPAKSAWAKLSKVEDSYVSSDAVTSPKNAKALLDQYDTAHREFIDALSALMRSLRFASQKAQKPPKAA